MSSVMTERAGCRKDAREIIENAVSSGAKILNEVSSKKFLGLCGLPVISEKTVYDLRGAAEAAAATGFPVAIKGMGEKLAHKTEKKIVCLNIFDAKGVEKSVRQIIKNGGDDLQAMVVQPQLAGRRELVAGMFSDSVFGKVIMLGLGGIFTEALNDVVFRIAPLTPLDALEMMDELRSRELFDGYRGESQVDRGTVTRILLSLSEIASDYDCIGEIDINPLVVSSDGSLTAVDALVVLGKPDVRKYLPPVNPQRLGSLFYPRSLAFVGASSNLGKWGHMLLTNTLGGDYPGDVYLVNPKSERIAGRSVYKSVMDIPGEIDLAVVTIPAGKVKKLIPQFKSKGVRGVLLITSGFRETGPEGRAIEDQLVREAGEAGIIILGPNTMGVCNPHNRFFCCGAHVYPLPGSTALVSQSGNMGVQLLTFAEQQDIGIRAFSGSGNEAMVTVEDYMEAFEGDSLTKTVVMYIESVKNGRRFLENSKQVSMKKPVVVLKGGRTDAGGRAASSHTGALASDSRIFDAACRQAGIVQAEKPMELLDLSAVFSSLPLPGGSRVAIMTLGGGWGVVTADICSENNLEVPELSDEIIGEFDRILPEYWSRSNPVDIVGENDIELAMEVVEKLLCWNGCDAVIHLGIHGKRIFVDKMAVSTKKTDPGYSDEFITAVKKELISQEEKYIRHVAGLADKYEKPLIGVSLLTDSLSRTLYRTQGCRYKTVFFPSPERAVRALAGMCRYRKWLSDRKDSQEEKMQETALPYQGG